MHLTLREILKKKNLTLREDRGVFLLAIPLACGGQKEKSGAGRGLTGGFAGDGWAGGGVPRRCKGGSATSSSAAAAPPGVLLPRSELRPDGGCAGLRQPWAAEIGRVRAGERGEARQGGEKRWRRRGRSPPARHTHGEHGWRRPRRRAAAGGAPRRSQGRSCKVERRGVSGEGVAGEALL
jgi:hypothetical protein